MGISDDLGTVTGWQLEVDDAIIVTTEDDGDEEIIVRGITDLGDEILVTGFSVTHNDVRVYSLVWDTEYEVWGS